MLNQDVQAYLAVRRVMGFGMKWSGNLLRGFAAFSEAAGQHHICSETAIKWAGSTPSVRTRARRLGLVIRLARYLRAEDQRHEVPPPVFGSEDRPRRTPYIYSKEDVQRLVQAASGVGLRVFADDMTRLWEEGEREVEGRADATHDAVHIVSIHSAKGLEWPVVVPINLVTAMRSATGVLHRATDDTLHFSLKTLNPPEYDLLKEVENRELGEERIRLLYVACTRARDLLVFPHYLGKLGNCWHKQVDLQLHDLPEFTSLGLTEGERKSTAPPLNEQTPEVFRHEALRLVERTRNIQWIQPSAIEAGEIPLPAPPEGEFAEPIPEVRGSAGRGRVLHKLMEEILLGETQDDEAALQTRAAELLRQLGQDDHPDPSKGPSSQEIASAIGRTLQLPIVAQYRQLLQPEFGVFQLRSTEKNETACTAGIVDAIAYNLQGHPELVFDWKSDVAPTPNACQRHASQVREYLDCTEAERGFVVYMTTGELKEVAKGRLVGGLCG